MAVAISPDPVLQFFDNRGEPAAGGSVLTQVSGVNQPTFQDSAGMTPLPNPVPLNSRGEVSNASGLSCQMFLTLGIAYTFTLFDKDGNQLNQPAYVSASFSSAQLAASTGAGLIGYSHSNTYPPGTVGAKLRTTVSVKDAPYNAKGDNSTDDTSAIQAAIDDALIAENDLYFPAGTYLVTGLLVGLTGNQSIGLHGEGQVGTILKKSGVSTTPVLYIDTADSGLGVAYWIVEGMQIYGNGVAITNCDGLRVEQSSRGLLQNLLIKNCYKGMYFKGSEQFLVENVMSRENGFGVYADLGDGATNVCNLVTLSKVTVVNNAVWGIFMADSDGWLLDGVVVENNGVLTDFGTGGIVAAATYGTLTGFGNLTLQSCWLENNNGYAFKLSAPVSANCTLAILQTKFVSNNDYAMYIDKCRSVSIIDTTASTASDITTITADVGSSIIENSTLYTFTDNASTKSYRYVGNSSTVIENMSQVVLTAQIKSGTSASATSQLWNAISSGDNVFQTFIVNTGGNLAGYIDYNRGGGVVRYNTSSDGSLKNILGDASREKSLEILRDTKLRNYEWKDNPGKVQLGPIAQELKKVYSGAVSEGGMFNIYDEDSNVIEEKYRPWAVDKTAYVWHQLIGWQQHDEDIAELKKQIAELKKVQ